MSERQITATVLDVIHHDNSRNGNPQYLIVTDEGSWLTMNDYNFAYGARNYYPRRSDGVYCVVTLTLRRPRKYEYVVNIEGPNMMELREKRLEEKR